MKVRSITIIKSFVALIVFTVISSCTSKHSNGIVVSYMPVQIEENGYWSFIGRDGEIILRDEFSNNVEVSPVVDGVFFVDDDKVITVYRLIDERTYEEIDGLSELVGAGFMQDGLMPICRKAGRIEVVDIEGQTQFELTGFEGVEIEECESYREGFMLVHLHDNTIVYVNKDGENAFGTRFESGSPFINGHAVVKLLDDEGEGHWAVLDRDGDISQLSDRVQFGKKGCIDFNNQRFACENKDRMHIYDFRGDELCKCPPKVTDTYILEKDYYVFKK